MHYFGVDIGNSGIRVTRLDLARGQLGPALRLRWRLHPTSEPHSSQNVPGDAAWIAQLEELLQVSPATWLVSSVRRDASQVLQTALRSRGHTVRMISYQDLPLTVDVIQPAAVGIDRLLAALAAARLVNSLPIASATERIIVIQAGSAVTVDQVRLPKASEERIAFEGGAIVPGVPMILRLLGQGADLLPVLEADDLMHLPALPGKDTEQAMLCGAASALVGGVAHLVARYREKLGHDLPVILSGGDGTRLAPHLDPPVVIQPDLVQHGLLAIAQASHPAG